MPTKSFVHIDFGGDALASFNKASAITRDDARPVLDFLSAGFVITWFQERSPRLWLALLKPKDKVRDHFLLSMECLLIGHGFPQDFQQRTLLAEPPDDISFRVSKAIRFVSSSAAMMRAACAAWAVQNRIAIVPIDDASIDRGDPDGALYKLLSDALWRRDVFDDSEPVIHASEFFGRELVVQELVSRVYLGQLAAIFGLRKIGKSSVLRRVMELLDADTLHLCVTSVVLCNATRIKSGRWSIVLNDLLADWADVLNRRAKAMGSPTEVTPRRLAGITQTGKPAPTDGQIADAFQYDVEKILRVARSLAERSHSQGIRLVALFDEADELYPDGADPGYWRYDYFALWNTLQTLKRGLDDPTEFSYLLFGVNPTGVESGSILGKANPLFELSPNYLKPLAKSGAKALLCGLGERVGLSFDDAAVAAAFEISGGHPWLLRKLGSQIHKASQAGAAATIDEGTVRRVFERTKRTFYQHVDWILQHLKNVAPDEYRLLKDIAVGGKDRYHSEWADVQFRETFAEHLAQYGLVHFEATVPAISIGLIRNALASPNPTLFADQKSVLREMGEALEDLIRIRISTDVANGRSPEEAVAFVVEAVPKEAKHRPKDREQLRSLGLSAGMRALVEALNWGDYLLVLARPDSGIVWSGSPMDISERQALLSETITVFHLARHNNDSALQKEFECPGYNSIIAKLGRCREMLGA